MGQTASKEDCLFGYKIPVINLNYETASLQDKSILNDQEENEIRFKDIAIDKRHRMLNLSETSLYTITPNISLLSRIRKLDLSNNHLNELPEAIGYLYQLEQFSVSHNNLTYLPDTICHLSRLKDIELSYNNLKSLTPYIGHLTRLQSLHLNNNPLTELPFTLEGLSSLVLLDLSHNPISVLPAQIVQLPYLRRFRLDGCALATSIDHFNSHHNPPSLLEICARTLVSSKRPRLTDSLDHYLSSYNLCNHCRGPYFDSFVSRGRWIERNDIWVPLEYRLCSAHWSDESDRLFATFSFTPSDPQELMKPGRTFCKKLAVEKEDSSVLVKMKRWKHKMQNTAKFKNF